MAKSSLKPLVVAIIPARGGSKGIPRKNIRKLCGVPLIAYAIATAQASALIDRIFISTDDEEIAEVARQYGAEAPFLRPADLARDHTPPGVAINHTIKELSRLGCHPQVRVTLLPTHPFRTPGLVDRLINRCFNGQTHAVTVRSMPTDSWRYLTAGEHPRLLAPPPAPTFRHYGLAEAHLISARATSLHYEVISDPVALIDIDTESDWQMAEAVIHKNLFDFQTTIPCSV